MSRGLGKIQREVLETFRCDLVDEYKYHKYVKLSWLRFIAANRLGDTYEGTIESFRVSFNRAVRTLIRRGYLEYFYPDGKRRISVSEKTETLNPSINESEATLEAKRMRNLRDENPYDSNLYSEADNYEFKLIT
jgi:hypothetical protein